MFRRVVGPSAAVVLALGTWIGLPGAHAVGPRGAECELSGSATISPGLTTTVKSQSVTISTIKLTGCHAGALSAPGVPKTTTGTATTSPNTVTTKASCASGNLSLSASIAWSDGTTTTASVTTTGITASQ